MDGWRTVTQEEFDICEAWAGILALEVVAQPDRCRCVANAEWFDPYTGRCPLPVDGEDGLCLHCREPRCDANDGLTCCTDRDVRRWLLPNQDVATTPVQQVDVALMLRHVAAGGG